PEYICNDIFDILLLDFQAVIVFIKCHLRLNHPELDQMTACFGFFGSESRSHRKYFTMSHCSSFCIQLAALRKESIIIEVLRMEEYCRLYRRAVYQNRCIYLLKAVVEEKDMCTFDDLFSDIHHSMLFS